MVTGTVRFVRDFCAAGLVVCEESVARHVASTAAATVLVLCACSVN